MMQEREEARADKALISRQEAAGLALRYSAYLKHLAVGLCLPKYESTDVVSVYGPEEFSEKRLLGFMLPDEIALVTLAASHIPGNEDLEVIITVPTERGLSMYHNNADNTFWSNFFYRREGTIIRPVYTTEPIRVHAAFPVDSTIDGSQEAFSKLFPKSGAIAEIGQSKQQTKDFLQNVGIRVPSGGFLSEDDPKKIDEILFEIANLGVSGFVVKPDERSEGDGVRMFSTDEATTAREYARELIKSGSSVVIEERIKPFVLQKKEGEQEVDYNLRVITIPGKYPKIVEAEVRYADVSDKPINVARGARVLFSHELLESVPEDVLARMYDVALLGTEAFVSYVEGIDSEILPLLGWDIIPDEEGNPVVIEVNPCHPGGLGTLTRKYHSPPKGVSEKLLPAVQSYPIREHDQKGIRERSLRMLDLTYVSYEFLGSIMLDSKEYSGALNLLHRGIQKNGNQPSYYKVAGDVYWNTNNFEKAQKMYALARIFNPDNPEYMLRTVEAALASRNYDLALVNIDSRMDLENSEQRERALFAEAAARYGLTGDRESVVSFLLDMYPFEIDGAYAIDLMAQIERWLSIEPLEAIVIPGDPFEMTAEQRANAWNYLISLFPQRQAS